MAGHTMASPMVKNLVLLLGAFFVLSMTAVTWYSGSRGSLQGAHQDDVGSGGRDARATAELIHQLRTRVQAVESDRARMVTQIKELKEKYAGESVNCQEAADDRLRDELNKLRGKLATGEKGEAGEITKLQAEIVSLKSKLAAAPGMQTAREKKALEPNGGFATQQLIQFPGETAPSVTIEIGLHTAVMNPLGPENHVIGIEASLATIHQHWNALAKSNVLLLNAAMFDTDSLGVFQVREGWPAANSLVTNTDLDKIAPRFKVTKQDPVATLRLAHVFRSIPETTRIDLLKVDVQGVNWNVITSAGSDISRARAIFTECTRDHTNKDGETGVGTYGNRDDLCENIRKHLEAHGFHYLGKFVEGMDDVSADIALVKSSCLEYAKPCVGDKYQGIGSKGGDPEGCIGKAVHDHPSC